MTVAFTLATRSNVDTFTTSASLGDVVKYEFDITPWQDDNTTVTAAAWSVQDGSADISAQTLLAGKVSALVNFTQSGWNKIRIALTTATQTKTMWLKVNVIDQANSSEAGDDYGKNSC